ncbi:phosphoribosyl-AMP cyclohydrolase [Parasphingorhabdus cellanae]|uniref:Phosphoribosyl-AMP cyclohydrolase n=1 Tax=Parasphingorhabdus cellanae TaxID=2806553 RepID=A0ABX7T647_9SPHN|nr:phosphoribosyl-AMP cyclohydrolase [Parasphingorhabdus cellanae]QTD55982.1 phosphoribosyl-AMP cyclohydrolase [Parasphingorhabdus cellanae]
MTNDQNIDRESGSRLSPKYDSNGLVSAVVTDDSSGDVLMIAFMDAEALHLTQETGVAHFYSRSRQTLWKKGETSGNILNVVEMRIDCDQDAVWIKAKPAGPTCHTGVPSCFYRILKDGQLEPVE